MRWNGPRGCGVSDGSKTLDGRLDGSSVFIHWKMICGLYDKVGLLFCGRQTENTKAGETDTGCTLKSDVPTRPLLQYRKVCLIYCTSTSPATPML